MGRKARAYVEFLTQCAATDLVCSRESKHDAGFRPPLRSGTMPLAPTQNDSLSVQKMEDDFVDERNVATLTNNEAGVCRWSEAYWTNFHGPASVSSFACFNLVNC